ncbi:MAG TPA: response regulator [Candidatus Dormibacteraeota bacterium]|nr:response regulator [Candidatus Dormibacteraeota bacterium]
MAIEAGSVDILLVEDNPSDAELTLHAFRKFTNRLHLVRDGAEALEFIFATGAYAARSVADKPKVILLDIKLPKVDGLEVLRQIKADDRTRTIPVVLLTSSPEDRDIAQGYQLGVNSYIVKPVEFEQFQKTVRELGMYWLTLNEAPIDRVA